MVGKKEIENDADMTRGKNRKAASLTASTAIDPKKVREKAYLRSRRARGPANQPGYITLLA